MDYDPQSATHRRLVRYVPHAVLVTDATFRGFAGMLHPNPTELERGWRCEGLVWPFFGPEVDPRRVRWVDAHCKRDEERGGYPFNFRMAQKILTDVAYLGWRVRSGEIAREEDGQPRVCHEPLVEPGLFWWCYDHIAAERPAWSEGWAPPRSSTVATRYRPRAERTRARPGEVRFLAAGRVRCAAHGKAFVAASGRREHVELHCGAEGLADDESCARVHARPVELALCRAFVGVLQLDEHDCEALAQAAERQEKRRRGGAVEDVERQLSEQRRRYERAKQLSMQAPDLAADVLDEFRKAKQAVYELERRLEEARAAAVPSSQAWESALRAMDWAERIRATFLDWPHEWQARVIALALDDAALGWVSRHVLGLWMRWHGGDECREELTSLNGKQAGWTAEEDDALQRYYGVLTCDAARAMMPGRTWTAVKQRAYRLGLTRPRDGGRLAIAPLVLPAPVVANTMARYGFPLDRNGMVTSVLRDTLA